jgi:hypothetical protein
MSRQDRFNTKSESSQAMSLINSFQQQFSRFQQKRFDGAKKDFLELEDEVKIAVLNALGTKGTRFLLTEWPNNVPVGEEFTIIEVPPMLDGVFQTQAIDAQGNPQVDAQGQPVMIAVTAAMKKDRREEIKMIKDHNTVIEDMEKKCCTILSDRCNSAINQQFVSFGGDPIRYWDYLRRTFGPESRGPQEKGCAFVEFCELEMVHTERFTNFEVKLKRMQSKTGTSDDSANGLLQSDGTTKFKTQMLPDRLMPAIARCKELKMNYAQTIEFITQADDIQHQSGTLESDKRRKVNAIKRMVQDNDREEKIEKGEKSSDRFYCYNCNNRGHISRKCGLDACTYCKKFNCNHKANDCPKRAADNKKKSAKQWPKGRGNGKEEDHSPKQKEEKVKKSKPNQFKSKFQKRKDFKKKNVKRVSTHDDDDDDDNDDDDDDEDDYEDMDDDDDEDSDDEQSFGSKNAYRVFDAGKRIRAVKDTSRQASVKVVAKRPAIIDTGADEHCIKSINTFKNITEKYNSRTLVPEVELHQANGDVLEIESKGTVFPSVIENAYHVPSIDGFFFFWRI